MNLKPGGSGGFNNEEHMKKCSEAGSKEFKRRLKQDSAFKQKFSHLVSESNKNNPRGFAIPEVVSKLNTNRWTGKNHSDETKKKIGLQNSKCQKGERNSQYGSMWITNGIINRKVKKESVLLEGWYIGRVTNKSTNQ
jgi:hypothetical protein